MKHIVPILLLAASVLSAHASPRKSTAWPRPLTTPHFYTPPRLFTAPKAVTAPRPVTSVPSGERYVEGHLRADGTYVPGHFRANKSSSLYGSGIYGSKPYGGSTTGTVKSYTYTVDPFTGKRKRSTTTSGY